MPKFWHLEFSLTKMPRYRDEAEHLKDRIASTLEEFGIGPGDYITYLTEGGRRDVGSVGLAAANQRKQYTCPVCGSHDPNAYLTCNRPDCTDGRDPR